MDINENDLYKFDSNSNFYNDICDQYTSESGTDLTNFDRKNNFNNNNLSLCENVCEFKEYMKYNKKAVCDCKVKTSLNFLIN